MLNLKSRLKRLLFICLFALAILLNISADRVKAEHPSFILKYRVLGKLEVEDSSTKFDWMAIFSDRQTPVKSAEITLHLPAQLSKLAQNFTTNGVTVEPKYIDTNTIKFIAKEAISPQSYLSVSGSFPTNILNNPKSQWQSESKDNFWQDLALGMTVSFTIFGVMLLLIAIIKSLANHSRKKSSKRRSSGDNSASWDGGGFDGGGDGGSDGGG